MMIAVRASARDRRVGAPRCARSPSDRCRATARRSRRSPSRSRPRPSRTGSRTGSGSGSRAAAGRGTAAPRSSASVARYVWPRISTTSARRRCQLTRRSAPIASPVVGPVAQRALVPATAARRAASGAAPSTCARAAATSRAPESRRASGRVPQRALGAARARCVRAPTRARGRRDSARRSNPARAPRAARRTPRATSADAPARCANARAQRGDVAAAPRSSASR